MYFLGGSDTRPVHHTQTNMPDVNKPTDKFIRIAAGRLCPRPANKQSLDLEYMYVRLGLFVCPALPISP